MFLRLVVVRVVFLLKSSFLDYIILGNLVWVMDRPGERQRDREVGT